MNALIKGMIFRGLKSRFPNMKSILINVLDKQAVIKYADDSVISAPTGETDSKYFTMLAESKNMKFIKDIYCDIDKDAIVIRGDKEVII